MIFDTGPLLAAANRKDSRHADCVALLRSTRLIRVPGPVIAEAGFMIGRIAGSGAEAAFLRSLSTDRYEILNPTSFELLRAADLVAQYESLNLGTTDAIVMATAESRDEPRVATLDQRDFTVVTPSGFAAFDIHPK